MASDKYWGMVAGTQFHDVDLADTQQSIGSDVVRCPQFKEAMIAHFDGIEDAFAKKLATGLRTGRCVPVRERPSASQKIWKPGELFFKS